MPNIIKKQKKISEQTIRRVIREEWFNGRIAQKKPFINGVNRKQRLDFAREHVFKDPSY